MADEYAPTTVEQGGLQSISINRQLPDLCPPGHDDICFSASIGAARRLIPHESWEAAHELAAKRLVGGEQHCICGIKRKGRRGR